MDASIPTTLDWDDVRYFLAAFEAGSLSRAAARLGVAQATTSRRVAALEEKIGHALFDRSRDGLVPTEAAWLLQPHAEAMAAAAEGATAALSGLEERPAGRVRLAVPPGTAVDLVPRLLHALAQRYPDLRLEVLAGTRHVDLLRREAEVAIRTQRPEHGDLMFRRLPDLPLAVFVSSGYLDALTSQRPKRRRQIAPEELDWIQYSDDMLHIPMAQWVEQHRGDRPPVYTSDSFLAMRAAATAGVGAMVLPRVQGSTVGLVEVPGIEVNLPELSWYLVVHRALRRVPRIEAVIELLDEAILDRLRE
ncbi:LysR family transcriptional regulator [Haliangium sp.]|uniref:LysR family transcriptional regulator n=1 Tax=Haliangium sp. TaxID=2663208 RepID=UPI003D0AAFA1